LSRNHDCRQERILKHVTGNRCLRLILVIAALLLATQAASAVSAAVATSEGDAPPPNSITFWGHSCCYIDIEGYGIMVDPVFDERVFMRRRRIPPPGPTSYAATSMILLTHAHPDHLSAPTLAMMPASATILCPEPSVKYLAGLEMSVRALRPGDSVRFPGGKVFAVAAHHAGSRYGIRAKADGRALGFVIETPHSTVYLSGDTNLFPGMEEIGRVYQPDIAVLNINGHLHSMDSVQAARTIGAGTVIPMHFGAYGYLFLPETKKPRDYDEMARELGDTLRVLAIGEALPLRPGR
jgi:L-ascorbate metabolism protein UlaG (beta-lactamase superfamily)